MENITDRGKLHRLPPLVRVAVAWIPAIVGVGCIVAESTESFSSNHTTGPLRLFWQAIFGALSNAHWDAIHHIIRKSGHFLGYGTLSLLFYRAWYRTAEILHRPASRGRNVLYALACTLLTASADELHQHFLPDRTGLPQDVVIDMIGACVVQLAFWAVMLLFGKLCHRPKRQTA